MNSLKAILTIGTAPVQVPGYIVRGSVGYHFTTNDTRVTVREASRRDCYGITIIDLGFERT